MTAAAATAGGVTRPQRPSNLRRNVALALTVVVVAWSAVSINVDLGKLATLSSGLANVFNRMYLVTGPDLTYLETATWAMLQSIEIAWVGTIIGAVFSLPIGFFAAKNVSSGAISNVIRVLLDGDENGSTNPRAGRIDCDNHAAESGLGPDRGEDPGHGKRAIFGRPYVGITVLGRSSRQLDLRQLGCLHCRPVVRCHLADRRQQSGWNRSGRRSSSGRRGRSVIEPEKALRVAPRAGRGHADNGQSQHG